MRHWIGVYTVVVHPRHQGKGFGRALMAATAEAARALDVPGSPRGTTATTSSCCSP